MTLRLLIVEDSPTDAKLLVHELRRLDPALEFVCVEEADTMRTALLTGTWDVVVSDWSMPRFSALAALRVLQEIAPEIPFIIVSGTVGEEHAVEAMRAGARDYVLKNNLVRLAPAIERELRERDNESARRRTERALEESEGRFRRLAESGIIGVFIADVHGRVHEANDAYLEMSGFTDADVASGGVRWDELTPPELRAGTVRALEQLAATGTAAPWESETLRKDGTRLPLLIGMSMLEHPRCIAFTVNLTERKKIEAVLHETENQLRQAQKMEAVGRLAGGIAHDFNNLLSVILSYSEMLQQDLNPVDPMHHDIAEIHRAGLMAASLTRQLLLFSRQQILQAKTIDLNDILAGMENMLRRLLGEDVELVVLTAPSSCMIHADPGSIEQVIMNLVVNARDAMPTGGQLTLETGVVVLDAGYARSHVGVTPGAYVMFAATDTGVGMDRATQARIFEPFFTTKDKGRGTGLGLSTVFGIVQQSAGSVWVYSEPGRGTTFKVYVPLAAGVVSELVSTPTVAPQGTGTILLVEDDDQVRVVARGILRRHGYRVIEARNGGEALLLCERHEGVIHLLLTDVVMPKMSGPELAARLALIRPNMRLLCMSGYTDDSIVRHGVLSAEIAFVQKPITPTALIGKVREVLGS